MICMAYLCIVWVNIWVKFSWLYIHTLKSWFNHIDKDLSKLPAAKKTSIFDLSSNLDIWLAYIIVTSECLFHKISVVVITVFYLLFYACILTRNTSRFTGHVTCLMRININKTTCIFCFIRTRTGLADIFRVW